MLVLLVLSVGVLSQEQSAQPITTAPQALGMPWDVLALSQLKPARRRQQQTQQQQAQQQQAQQPGGRWLADQEQRVASWRDRQRSIVVQQTAAEQARAAAAAASLSRRLGRAASALSVAAAADPLLDVDRARQGLSTPMRSLRPRPLRNEAQEVAAAALASGSGPAVVADE